MIDTTLSEPAPERSILSVSQLNRAARMLLESGLGVVWVAGEMSNFSRPGSGHWYFSLKDGEAQLRCAMFRPRNALCLIRPGDGMQILARGKISLYEARGDYQLIVEHIEAAGEGALKLAFEALKQRLQAEGLFSVSRKRPLPSAASTVGVITSPTGAALRDILQIMARRFPAMRVIVYPVPVQGTAAPAAIAAALDIANARAECEVLIVARGGGSLEDLQAFNDEAVARAIARSTLPVISGVGHETDLTIADFVADVRAPTPSGAAQLVTPDRAEWLARLERLAARLQAGMRRKLADVTTRARTLGERLQRAHPGARLTQHAQRLDDFEMRLRRAIDAHLVRAQSRIEVLARGLQAVSPLATLDRGYAIVTVGADARVVTDIRNLDPGSSVHTRLAHGSFAATVTKLIDTEPK